MYRGLALKPTPAAGGNRSVRVFPRAACQIAHAAMAALHLDVGRNSAPAGAVVADSLQGMERACRRCAGEVSSGAAPLWRHMHVFEWHRAPGKARLCCALLATGRLWRDTYSVLSRAGQCAGTIKCRPLAWSQRLLLLLLHLASQLLLLMLLRVENALSGVAPRQALLHLRGSHVQLR